MLTKLQALITILLCVITMSVNIQNQAICQSRITIQFGAHHKRAFGFLTQMLNNNCSYWLTGNGYNELFVDPANNTALKEDAMDILDKLFANYVKGLSDHSASGNNSAEVKHMKKMLKAARWYKTTQAGMVKVSMMQETLRSTCWNVRMLRN